MARRLVKPRRTTPGRLIFGLLIACTLPGAFLGFAGALESGLLQRPHEALVGIAAFALVLLYFVLPAALCLGLPLLWLLRRLARESWWAFALGGALAAVLWIGLIFAATDVSFAEDARRAAMAQFLTVVALPGALAGLGFWFSAYLPGGPPRRRSRRDAGAGAV